MQGVRQEGTSRQIGGEALIYIERRLTSFVKGGELVELLRFKWEQQSKKAVIMVQQQEVTGCESRCVCLRVWVSPGTSCPAMASTSPHTGHTYSKGSTAHCPTNKQPGLHRQCCSDLIGKCTVHMIHSSQSKLKLGICRFKHVWQYTLEETDEK